MASKKAKKTVRKPALKKKKQAKPAAKARRPVAKKAKKTVKNAAAKARVASKTMPVDPSLEKIGEVTHYFPHVNAAAVKILKDALRIGDQICIKGHTTDFKEDVSSIQLDHATIPEGKKGMEIGLLVKERVRIGDTVYRVKR